MQHDHMRRLCVQIQGCWKRICYHDRYKHGDIRYTSHVVDVEQGRCLRSCKPSGSASVLLFFVQLSVERRIVIRSRYLAIGGKQNYDFDELARTVEVEASSLKVLPTGASSWRMSIFLSRLDAHEGKSSHVVELDIYSSFSCEGSQHDVRPCTLVETATLCSFTWQQKRAT